MKVEKRLPLDKKKRIKGSGKERAGGEGRIDMIKIYALVKITVKPGIL